MSSKRIVLSFYIRKSELPYNQVELTEEAGQQQAEKALKIYKGFNCIDPDVLLGLKIARYKLVERGNMFFFSVTLTDQKRSILGCKGARTLLQNLMSDENRWQTAVYHNPDGSDSISCRERTNSVRQNRTRCARKPVLSQFLR